MAKFCKYYKQQRQVSYDGGITWQNLGEYQKGELYERNSADCGYQVVERWATTGYTCVGYDKYSEQVKELSYDGGTTWQRTSETRNTLFERNSFDCGYGVKVEATLKNGTVERIACSQSITADSNRITSADTSSFVANIQELVIYDCAEIIDNGAFKGATGMTAVTIPSSVTTTRTQAFQGCTSLKDIYFPMVTEVGQACFSDCTSLSGVSIPNAVTIGVGCFMSCTALKEIELPSTVTSIGMYAFDFCSSLKKLKVNAITPPTVQHEILLNTPSDLKIYVPCQSLDAYKTANIWSNYADKIVCEDIPQTQYRWFEVRTWCDGSNLWMTQKKQVSNDYGVTWNDVVPEETQDVVKDYNSSECHAGSFKLTTIGQMGRQVTVTCNTAGGGKVTSGDVLGNESLMSHVTYVKLGSCATELMTNAFWGTAITSIVIPSGVTEFHNYVFIDCTSLETAEFEGTTPPTFGSDTFRRCTSLEKIIVPQGSLSAYRAVSNLSQWSSLMEEKQ